MAVEFLNRYELNLILYCRIYCFFYLILPKYRYRLIYLKLPFCHFRWIAHTHAPLEYRDRQQFPAFDLTGGGEEKRAGKRKRVKRERREKIIFCFRCFLFF